MSRRRRRRDSAWPEMRDRYAHLFETCGRTQADVARIGGLSGQAAVSKVLANSVRGPTMDVFVKAVNGLGVSLAQFFEPWSAAPPSPSTLSPSDVARVAALVADVVAERLRDAAAATQSTTPQETVRGGGWTVSRPHRDADTLETHAHEVDEINQ